LPANNVRLTRVIAWEDQGQARALLDSSGVVTADEVPFVSFEVNLFFKEPFPCWGGA